MIERDYNEDRETIWGINRQDRPWFQLLTLLGGVVGSIILTVLAVNHGPPDSAPGETAGGIVLGIGGSFVASGFIAWGLLQCKELIMSIAYWIKRRNAKNRAELIAQGVERGIEQGIERGIEQGIERGYEMGYEDAQSGRPRRAAASDAGQVERERQPRRRRARRRLNRPE